MTQGLFGTDGIRGRAGTEPLTPESLERLGAVLAAQIGGGAKGERPHALLGHDGRESGETLVAALVKGLLAGGVDVDVAGLAPTPCIAYLTKAGGYAAGVMVSASHNPAEDNGVKLLGPDGSKLDDAAEAELEAAFFAADPPAAAGQPGEARRTKGMLGDYLAWLRGEAFPELSLKGWKVAIDCANGAYSQLGPRVLKAFGAEAVALHNKPDGRNINADCGALHPEVIAAAVVEHGCRAGLALDGDGDRGMLADGDGRLLDGDALLAGFGVHFASRGRLRGDSVVATVMSNLALERHLAGAGVRLIRTPVGDRYVAAAMRAGGYVLGGEKSGHVLFGSDHGYRGDGIYTFLRAAQAIVEQETDPTQFAFGYADLPQQLLNLHVLRRAPLDELPALSAACARVEARLGKAGRLVVRFSGTELRLRLMAEAETKEQVDRAVQELAHAAAADGILA
ncbi:MAG TPA: phosphoglucosamine mutase [Planctomycetota bacterium]